MCGLIGFIDYKKKINPERFDDSIDKMHLRGPDARGARIHQADKYNVGLGHRRLSIIDLDQRANQPFYDEDLGIIFNGEIYNYKSLKDELLKLGIQFSTTSDTEVILKAYRQWGLDCVEKFLGMFAIGIYDVGKSKVVLLRDRLGVKPLYFYQDDQTMVFSSDAVSINYLLDNTLALDKRAIHGFFSLGFVPALHSIFEGIQKVKPGAYLEIDLNSKKTKQTQYWDLKEHISDLTYKSEDKKKLKTLLEDAVRLRLVSDVKVGSFLSGGLDSSYITKLLSDHSEQQLSSFTVGFHEDFDEAPHAKEVAELIGTAHTTYYLQPHDISDILLKYSNFFNEPFADNTCIPMLYLSQNSKNKVKVVVSSDGGDELFAGYYEYFTFLRYNRRLKKVPGVLRSTIKTIIRVLYTFCPNTSQLKSKLWKLKHIFDANSSRQLQNLLQFGSRISHPVLKEVVDGNVLKQKFNYGPKLNNLNTSSDLKKMLYTDITESLVNKMLVKVDKSTMGASIEGREPLLDHRLFEFMFSYHEDNFIKNGTTKYRFREIINDEFEANNLLNKPKKSFETPLLKWLKEYYSDYIESELKSINKLKIPYLSQDNLLKLWKAYHDIMNNQRELIWRAIVFIQWYKVHILQLSENIPNQKRSIEIDSGYD
jgi:asparagine synthase (glutamine-hydrolysing)